MFSGVSIIPAGDPIGLLDELQRAGSDHALVVAPRALAGQLRTDVTVATGRFPELGLCSMISEHAPLAILSAMALARSSTKAPALAVGLVQRLLENSWSGAWTHSVAKLTEPAPQLGQHLRSYLPGAGFLLRQSPSPAVLGRRREGDVPTAGIDRVLLVQEGAVPRSFAERLSHAAGVVAVRQVTLPGRWTSVYGTDRTGQLALMPATPQQLFSPVTHRCPACQLDQISTVCPFCRVLGQPDVQVSHSGGLS